MNKIKYRKIRNGKIVYSEIVDRIIEQIPLLTKY